MIKIFNLKKFNTEILNTEGSELLTVRLSVTINCYTQIQQELSLEVSEDSPWKNLKHLADEALWYLVRDMITLYDQDYGPKTMQGCTRAIIGYLHLVSQRRISRVLRPLASIEHTARVRLSFTGKDKPRSIFCTSNLGLNRI